MGRRKSSFKIYNMWRGGGLPLTGWNWCRQKRKGPGYSNFYTDSIFQNEVGSVTNKHFTMESLILAQDER